MSHIYNRQSFRTGCRDITSSSSSLLSAYCRLVGIELLLKSHLSKLGVIVPHNHDVPSMLVQLQQQVSGADVAELSPFVSDLPTQLKQLWCQGPSTVQRVPQHSYPYIRYVRTFPEFKTQYSNQTDVDDLEALTEKLQLFLLKITGLTA
jgi:hypothetical protein